MTDTALIPTLEVEQTGLTRYQPANLKQLVWFAGEVAKSGMYLKTNASGDQVPMSQAETFMVMSEGVEMGISPITAMRNIYLMEDKRGRKTTIPRADLIAARIQADPRTEQWDVDDATPGIVTITAKRHNREAVSTTLELKDIPARDKERWAKGYLDTQDMLTNRTIRKIARRHFRDMVLGLGIDQDVDDRRVIDIAKVERQVGAASFRCETCGKNTAYVQANSTGGAFLRCSDCGATGKPPQEVRDAVRGTPEHLTLAGAAEPVLEPGERLVESSPLMRATFGEPVEMPDGGIVAPLIEAIPVDAPVSAVQSESSAIIDEVIPASAETAPLTAMPDDPVVTSQAMRNAAYSHWIRPRPTQNKIEMRGLLEEFGWTTGETLMDWMVTLPDDKLAAVCDAIVSIP